jgi:hypothetical protein
MRRFGMRRFGKRRFGMRGFGMTAPWWSLASRPHALSTAGDARMRVELEVPSKEGQHDFGNLRQRPMNRFQAAPSDACSECRAFSVTGARAGGLCSQGSGMDWRGDGTD